MPDLIRHPPICGGGDKGVENIRRWTPDQARGDEFACHHSSTPSPMPGWRLITASSGRRRIWSDILRAKAAAGAVGENDGADHRHEEDEPGASKM
jgi:hypothetical protein